MGLIFPNTPVQPTNAISWEAGAKLEFFNGKLRATADYFDLVKTNITTPEPNPILAAENFVIVTGEAQRRAGARYSGRNPAGLERDRLLHTRRCPDHQGQSKRHSGL
jgi:outer membrane receptor protein involved in Fe transport